MALDLEKLEDTPHLLDILIQLEDVLDSADIYCFRNWLSGEVVEGPVIRRHWISFSLMFPHGRMPDPRGARRLLKLDAKVEFSRMKRAATPTDGGAAQAGQPPGVAAQAAPKAALETDAASGSEVGTADHAKDGDAGPSWLVKITVPRRLLDQLGNDDLYDDEVDADDVGEAKDAGIDSESAYTTDEQAPDEAGFADPAAPGTEADAPPGDGNDAQ